MGFVLIATAILVCFANGESKSSSLRGFARRKLAKVNDALPEDFQDLEEFKTTTTTTTTTTNPFHSFLFGPLSCNDSVQMEMEMEMPCEGWSTQEFDPTAGTVVIPCGKCILMDMDVDVDMDLLPDNLHFQHRLLLSLPHGLNIEGKLVIPDGYQITIKTPFLLIQGELEMTSTGPTSGQEDVQIILTNLPPEPQTETETRTTTETGRDREVILSLHPEQKQQSGIPQKFGTRPVVVAGGKLTVQGLPEGCPSWTKPLPSYTNMDAPTYTPTLTPSHDCSSEFIPNGNAEETDFLSFAYPVRAKNGILTVESETTPKGTTNHYYALSNRDVTWASPTYDLPVECINAGTLYAFGLDIRMHSITQKSLRLELAVTFDNDNAPILYHSFERCPPQDFQDGWVHCTANYRFPEYKSAPTRIEFYLVQNIDGNEDDASPDEGLFADADFDNISVLPLGPQMQTKSIRLPDPQQKLSSCWGVGSQLLVTSSNLDYKDVATPTILKVTPHGDDTVTVDLDQPIDIPIEMPMPSDGNIHYHHHHQGVFAVEVALLSRNIAFSSDSDEFHQGGHLMVYHTNRQQQLDGVSFQKFGQQGNLGRYPVHFHMSGSATGSVVSRNVVINSNQRCFVIHGTHKVLLDSNVCYNHFGHGFLLEDHSERNNVLQNNLVAVTKKVLNKISDDESDDFPASYWITNTENMFIGNVAAGSEDSGFWFEMSTTVRGPSARRPENLDYNPREQSLQVFSGNVAHSNQGHGIKTYPGGGYLPKGEPAVFKDCISFRNVESGVFLHNSGNIKIQGGIYADNRVLINIDASPACSVDGAKLIGYSNEFRSIKQQTGSKGHCPSIWPLKGVEIHSQFVGGSENDGASITNTVFQNFEDTGCNGTAEIFVDEENQGYFDVRTRVQNLTFANKTNSVVLKNCPTTYSGLDNFVLRDVDGSIMDEPGYMVSDVPALTIFANCSSNVDSCTAYCPGACFRSYVFSVSILEAQDPTLELEITDTHSNQGIRIHSSYKMPLDADGSIQIAEHTKTYRNNLFYAILPSGGDYAARFTKGGKDYWPLFVRADYDDPGSDCPDFNSFTIIEPDFDYSTTCKELIHNGDMESGIDGWLASSGGLKSRDESSTGQGLALTSMYRTSTWMGPAQYLDTRCLILGARYSISYKAKLISASDGSPIDCNPLKDACPKLIGKLESSAHEENDPHWKLLTRFPMDGIWIANGWNTINGTILVDQQMVDAGSTEVYFESKTLHTPDLNGDTSQVLMVIDDVHIQLEYWPEKDLQHSPSEYGILSRIGVP